MQKKKLLLVSLALLASQMARAQAGTAGALEGISFWVNTIGNIVFAIVVVIGLIRVITKFVKGEPDSVGALFQLIIAVGLWGGFQLIQDDLVGLIGSSGR